MNALANKRWLAPIALLMALAVYFGIGLTQLRLPGLQYDEAVDAVSGMQVLLNQPLSSMGTITLFGRTWPLMVTHHEGPASIYTSLIGMALFGISVEGLRITQLCVGAISLVLLWMMARAWFGVRAASIAVLLCATAPAFIWWNRAGANWTAPALPLALAFAMSLRHAYEAQRLQQRSVGAWLFCAALFFGIGFTTKIFFVWLLAPVALTVLVALGPHRVLAYARALPVQAWACLLIGLVLGLLPFIVHNLQPTSFLATFKFVLNNASETRLYSHNNLDFGNNLMQVGSEFFRMIGGDTVVFNAPMGLPLSALALFISLLYTAWRLIRHWDAISHAGLRLFLLLSVVAVLPISTVSTSQIGATYLFFIVPFSWLLVATALNDLITASKSWSGGFSRLVACACSLGRSCFFNRLKPPLPFARLFAYALVIILCANHIVTNVRIHRFFAATGGRGLWSDSIYDLNDMLQARYADRNIVAMDWGFTRNLQLLSLGRVVPQERFEYAPLPPPSFEDLSIAMLREPQNVYLFHAEDRTAFRGRWRIFERAALKTRKQLVLLQAFAERTGITNTLVYEAHNAQPQFDVPKLAQPRNAQFDDAITLLGGEASYDPMQHEIAIKLYWQAHAKPLRDDTVLLHVVEPSTGQAVLTGDQQPLYGNYPCSKWRANEVVTDVRWITLPKEFKPGLYQVRVGLYDTKTGNRRTITDPQNDAAGNSLMLQMIDIR